MLKSMVGGGVPGKWRFGKQLAKWAAAKQAAGRQAA